jgi:ParG.
MNEPIPRIPVYISRALHRDFKSRCTQHGQQIQEVAEMIVRNWLSLPDKKAFPKNNTK